MGDPCGGRRCCCLGCWCCQRINGFPPCCETAQPNVLSGYDAPVSGIAIWEGFAVQSKSVNRECIITDKVGISSTTGLPSIYGLRQGKKSCVRTQPLMLDFQSGTSSVVPLSQITSHVATTMTEQSLDTSTTSPAKRKRKNVQTNNAMKQRSKTSVTKRSCLTSAPSSGTKSLRNSKQRGNLSTAIVAASVNEVDGGTSSNYIDLGDCTNVCEYCNAFFWADERLRGHDQKEGPKYNKCCATGKIAFDMSRDPPERIKMLFQDKHFIDNIRVYNQMFSMTSFGAKVDEAINNGRGPYVFKVSGQIYHWIGSMCPSDGDPPRFLQLYIYDSEHEVSNRLRFYSGTKNDSLSPAIVELLIDFFNGNNELVKLFRTARDKCREVPIPDFKIRLYSDGSTRRYELPTSDTLGGIVFESGPSTASNYDVIIELKGGHPQRIDKLHPSYMSLQLPLLFLYGQPGFHTKLRTKPVDASETQRRISMNMFYMYQLHPRLGTYDLLFRSGRLFQQYVVNVYCSIEQNRIDYIRANQNDIRNDHLSGIYDAISKGDRDGSAVGTRVILPSSFTGGPRYMYSHYLDALAICRVLGNPQFFITFTCNVGWPEIRRYMAQFPTLSPSDRADIVCRIFNQKINAMVQFLKERKPFGDVKGVLYTVEFQKRGLPHCHTLSWVEMRKKIEVGDDLHEYISAELPDPAADPDGYHVVSEMMIHGPCGLADPKAPCMDAGRCMKKFPKKFNNVTYFDRDGHTHYRRRDTNITASRRGVSLDNSYVVPYNRTLLLAFRAHINVEYCGWSMLIKYLFKYISKGTDRIVAHIARDIGEPSAEPYSTHVRIDEIKNFLDCRYICPHEACWRILNFDIHSREPAVQVLAVHLEGMQQLHFRAKESLQSIVGLPERKKTTLTQWFEMNNTSSQGHHLTYVDFPKEFVWYGTGKYWSPRKLKSKASIGRLAYIHPSLGELYFLRMLLCHQKGSQSFVHVRTINHRALPTYRAACYALGLLGDDKEWDIALEEAAGSSTSFQLRSLFTHILIYCDVSDPIKLWNTHWQKMCDDIPIIISRTLQIDTLNINHPEIEQYALFEIETLLNTYGKCVTDFGLPAPPQKLLNEIKNRLLMEERNYDRSLLFEENKINVPKLNTDQRKVYDLIVQANTMHQQQLIFVYGHGGTGKKFLWKTIINGLRSHGKIVLAVASSGIASLLLPSGRTTHSRFKLPLDLTDESLCRVKRNTYIGNLLIETELIIWDEAPMNERRCFETLDRTLQDLLQKPDVLFGGKSIVLGGDFRQTLPVKKGASKSEIVALSITESYLWPHFKVFILHDNMRLLHSSITSNDVEAIKTFASWLIDIGDGKVGSPCDDDPDNSSFVEIPPAYCTKDDENGLSELIEFIYDKNCLEKPSAELLQQKAIVCPRNSSADIINQKILSMTQGEAITYASSDEATPCGNNGGETEMLYPLEYLNQMTFGGLPPHLLQLKVGTPIMLLRNVNVSGGLCNETRLIVKQLLTKVIEAQIITGTRVGEKVFLHRIPLTHKEPKLPFTFKRKQFPIKLCYAMTINKSQGQSLNRIGIYLPEPIFSHGQFVAIQERMSTNNISELRPGALNKTIDAKVYRKWTSKQPPSNIPNAYCCILLDRDGNAIQVNMDLGQREYFDAILALNSAYRITNFKCVKTDPFHVTLPNDTTLKFGRYTKFEDIPLHGFPNHHFNFIPHEQLEQRVFNPATKKYPILTEEHELRTIANPPVYSALAGVLQIADPTIKHNARGQLITLRKIDIEDLSNHTVELTLWDEDATNFDKEAADNMERPVVIAVTSCRVSKFNNFQLLATPATHCYLNPNIHDIDDLRARYRAQQLHNPLIQVQRYTSPDPEKEKYRNRFTLSQILEHNPDNFTGIKFTCRGTIMDIDRTRPWHYLACSVCQRKLRNINGTFQCIFHGPQPNTNYRYNIRANIKDQTASAIFTFFTPVAEKLTGISCPELLEQHASNDTYDIPQQVTATEGKTCILRFHFNTESTIGGSQFTVDDVLDIAATNGSLETNSDKGSTSGGTDRIPSATPPSGSLSTPTTEDKHNDAPPTMHTITTTVTTPVDKNDVPSQAKRALFSTPESASKKRKED